MSAQDEVRITNGKIKAPKISEDLNKIAEKIREGKINKPGELKSSTGFDLLWDGSLEIVAKTLEATSDIIKAINTALTNIRNSEWYKNQTKKEQQVFEDKFTDHVNDLYSKAKEPTKGEKEVSPLEKRAKEEQAEQRVKEKEVKAIKTTKDKVRQLIFDSKKAYKNFQEEVVDEGGQLTDRTDAYKAETLSHSKVLNTQEEINKEQVQPLLESVANISKKNNVTVDSIMYYLMAKHAPERNQELADRELAEYRNKLEKKDKFSEEEIDKKVAKEKAKLDKAIADGKYNKSGMTTSEAQENIVWMEDRVDPADLAKLHKTTKNLTNKILDMQLDYQLISQEQYDKVKELYDYYVPLRGWDRTASSELVYKESSGEGFAARTPITKGRTSLADNPLANLLNMADALIVEGEKNRIKIRAKAFLSSNKDFLQEKAGFRVTYKVMREVDVTRDGKTTREFQEMGEYESKSEIPKEFKTDEFKIVTNVNASTKEFKDPKKAKDHEVHLMENGEPVILQYEDPQVAMALNNKDFNQNLEKATAILNKSIGPVTRFMSSMFTSRNPGFIIPNMMRDFMLANTVHYVKGGVKQQAKFIKNFGAIQKALIQGPDAASSDKYRKMYSDFKKMGGETGYVHMKNIEDFKRSIQNDIKALQGNAWATTRKGLRAPFKALDKMAAWSENMARLATYATAIEMGESKTEAANQAKNITVNFNKKGRVSGLLGSLYAFFNAGLQGVNLYGSLWEQNWKRMSIAHTTFMATGFLSAMLTDMLGSEDDDDPMSDHISDYTKYNHFIIPTGKDEYVKLPMPHIFRMWHGLGSMGWEIMKEMGRIDMMDVPKEEQERLREKAIGQRLSYFANSIPQDFLPMDVAGLLDKDGELSRSPIMPTFTKPFYELGQNKNFMGLPIYKEPFTPQEEKKMARSQMYFQSINPTIRNATNWIYQMGGGDLATGRKHYIEGEQEKAVKRVMDINPEHIEHLIGGYFGGTGKFVNNVAQTAYSIVNDDEINMDKFPVVHRFLGDAKFDRSRDEYFKNREKADIWIDLYKENLKIGNKEKVKAIGKSKHWKQIQIFSAYDDKIKDLRDMLKKPGISEKDQEYIAKQIKLLTRQANKEME
jgi:hypothetical protein